MPPHVHSARSLRSFVSDKIGPTLTLYSLLQGLSKHYSQKQLVSDSKKVGLSRGSYLRVHFKNSEQNTVLLIS